MRELTLLHRVYGRNATLPSHVTIPPGDDMGAVAWGGGDVLIAVDQVVEGVHFEAGTAAEHVALKAVARNISDVAAMACEPVASVCSVCVPRGWSDERADELARALSEAGLRMGCPMIGGDVSATDGPLVVSVTVLARAWPGVEPVLRSGAGAGDWVYVSGVLGGSMESMQGQPPHHLVFEPGVDFAKALLLNITKTGARVTAMIDVSDGLAMDLARICRAASERGGERLGAEVEVSRLPLSPAAEQAAARSGRGAWEHAVGDGEDYELCFTLRADNEPPRTLSFADVTATRIGRIVGQPTDAGEGNVVGILADGGRLPLDASGWEHRS